MKNLLKVLTTSKELWAQYVAISFFTILLSLMNLLQPLLSGWAIDEIRKGSEASVQYALMLAVGIFLLDLGVTLFSNIGGYIGDQMSAKLNALLSRRYYDQLMKLPQTYFDTELSGKIINRLNRSIAQIAQFMQMMSNNFLQFVFSTIFSLVVVVFISWEVALMLGLLYPVYVYMTMRSSNTWQKYQEKKNLHQDIALGRFAESIAQNKVVKSFIQERNELSFFNKHLKTVIDTNKPQSKFWHKQDIKRRLVLNVIFLFVYGFIFARAAQGVFTPGQAVTLILYAMQIRLPIFTISFLVENTQRAISDSKDYFETMNIKPEIKDETGATELVVKKGIVEFSSVNFGYKKGQDVLKDISFSIEENTKAALVGESGEGKTTLTNLLLRLYEPGSGKITIDGQDVAAVTQKSLRQNIGVVFQDPALFSGTIKENIAYSNPQAPNAEVEAAAKKANAHEFIEKFEKGYETEIGERGLKLSGGQKQRIAIARALLKDAPILILDEATSSLDSKSEAMVQEALEHLMKDRTTIIIAHRLSTIAHVDRIITLKNGTVDEIGSPKQLAKSGGIYAQLLELQSTGTSTKKLKAYELV